VKAKLKIGIVELLVIFVIALFAIGPDKLPAYARKLGEALAQFRKYSEEATKDIKESIVEPLEAAQKPLRDAVQPLEEMEKEVKDNIKDVKASFKGIGKSKPSALKDDAGSVDNGQGAPVPGTDASNISEAAAPSPERETAADRKEDSNETGNDGAYNTPCSGGDSVRPHADT